MEILDRVKGPTPDFHKKLQKGMITLMAAAGAIIGLHETDVITLTESIKTGLFVFEAIGTAVLSTAQTAKK